jgi:hypothetical protein
MRALLAALVLVACALPCAAPAQQQRAVISRPLEPMRFFVAEGAGPRGSTRWIAATGQIRSDTPRAFADFRSANRIDGLPVVIDSPGGSVNGGMALGRELRKMKATLYVGRTLEVGGDPQRPRHRATDAEAQCNSSCVLVLMGAQNREVTRRAHVGVHLFSGALRPDGTRARDVLTVEDIEDAQRTMVRHAVYVREMGVEIAFLEVMAAAPFRGMRRISYAAPPAPGEGWALRRSADSPEMSRTLPLPAAPNREATAEVVIGCSSYRGFLLVTYRQTLVKLETGGTPLAVGSVRISAGDQDAILRPNVLLVALRQGSDLWVRRETPMRLIEAALAARELKVEPRRQGETRPADDFYDATFARHAPDLLRACAARPNQSSIGLHPRH